MLVHATCLRELGVAVYSRRREPRMEVDTYGVATLVRSRRDGAVYNRAEREGVLASREITGLLQQWSDGDEEALAKLTPVLYKELHRMAHRYMRKERPGHTLQTTALINEAYLRLIGWKNVHWQNRAHFFGVSAQLMRKILVDMARSRNYVKRGAGARAVSLDEAPVLSRDPGRDILALNDA